QSFKSSARAAGMSSSAFYAQYLQEYLSHLASGSWPYFAAAAVFVALGLLLFAYRQMLQQDDGFLAVLLYMLTHKREGESRFEVARKRFGDEAAEGPPAVLRIILVFSMVSVFWALFDQHASTWI